MKRGKDEEKVMGPMFPRLHVNDTEKGGPKAPPRNKMAVYEQLSIPSQRIIPGVLPRNPNSAANMLPPPSSTQGNEHERGIFYPLQLPQSMHLSEKPQSHYSELSTSFTEHEQKKKPDEDDFQVPIFVQPGIGEECGRNYSNMEHKKLTPSNPACLEHSINLQYSSGREPRGMSTVGLNSRQEGRSLNEGNLKVPVAGGGKLVGSMSNISSGRKSEGLFMQTNGSCDHPVNNYNRLKKSGESLQRDYASEPLYGSSLCDNVASNKLISGINNDNHLGDIQEAELIIPDDPIDDIESSDDRTCWDLPAGDVDKGDDASETSMVDSVSGLDISPDDVVGIIGQKHFWKARRAIVNQQRVFAVQVFELHRLIKVQKLISGSPHLLVEENAYLGKPLKGSPTKKLQLEYPVKAPQNVAKQKDDLEKPNNKVEGTAENAVGKTSLSFLQNGSQPPNFRPFIECNPPTSMTADSRMGPWCFHQHPSDRWMIPVLSPSEGLVYKPYPGHGYMMGPVCGVCGPPGSTPVMGNFFNAAYGFPACHQLYQGAGVPPFAPPACHGYFPPYGMPVMNPAISGSSVDLMNDFSASGLHGQLSGGGANNHQQQNSCNVPGPKDGVTNNAMRLHHGSKDSELQVSTASSASETGQATGTSHVTKARNALPLLPTSPAISIPDGASQLNDTDQPSRVIRVVPHNAKSATESAARIFQSIQRERKQYDLV